MYKDVLHRSSPRQIGKCGPLCVRLQEYTNKVGRAIADEPATTAYPALLVSLGSGVSIIKVGMIRQYSVRDVERYCWFDGEYWLLIAEG